MTEAKPILLWVPSQNGLFSEAPQRQSAMVFLLIWNSFPSASTSLIGPRTRYGPLSFGVILALSAIMSPLQVNTTQSTGFPSVSQPKKRFRQIPISRGEADIRPWPSLSNIVTGWEYSVRAGPMSPGSIRASDPHRFHQESEERTIWQQSPPGEQPTRTP